MATVALMSLPEAWAKVLATTGNVPQDAADIILRETGCKLHGLSVSNGMIATSNSIAAASAMCWRMNNPKHSK
jgi:hypothetical protein